MPLTPGARHGPYEIIAAIGAGGMGQVYKARDMRLNRLVALKVLPPAVPHLTTDRGGVFRWDNNPTPDPERRRRFVQEAQLASALQHPNIVTIFEIDSYDGVDSIAMEFVRGRSLDEVIPRKGLRDYFVERTPEIGRAHV